MLSYLGWLNGISILGYTVFGCLFGLLILYRSIKLKTRLLSYLGLTIFFAGLLILGPCVDFIAILITGVNVNNTYGIVGILSAVWAPAAVITGINIGGELLFPSKKKVILAVFTILGIIFEFFIFFDTSGSLSFVYPDNPGEGIIDTQLVLSTPAGLLGFGFMISLLIFNGVGFMIKAFQSTGIIRKKFLLLSLGYIIFMVSFMLESSLTSVIIVFFIRICLIIGIWLWYLGIKIEPGKSKEPQFLEEIELEESKIKLIESLARARPDIIPPEEVSMYREQNICLVCKGETSDLKAFMCSNCNTLYCETCAYALSNLENSCWVCNQAIDDSKPIRIYDKEKEKYKKLKEKTKKSNSSEKAK